MIVQKRMIDNGNERLDLWYRITYLGLASCYELTKKNQVNAAHL